MPIDHFSGAHEMLAALTNKRVSATELTDMQIQRIEAHDPDLNAIPVKTFDRAREAAKAADKRIAKGDKAPLLGLPMTLKESTLVAGLPQTAGIPDFKGYTPEADGPVAANIFNAGAGLLGKTNIPLALGDWQADSPVYGRTNNPWDLTRTPGGSTGGGAAALAAGMTPLELGSDIGGSIRIPAAYCGLYGHRPSETAVPRSGAFPMADLPNPAFLMGVQGPLARTAKDLTLLLDVIARPEPGEETGWQINLPGPRHSNLKDFRVAVMPSMMQVSASSQMQARLEELVSLLSKEGATVKEAMPALDMESYFYDYLRTLTIMVTQDQSPEERSKTAGQLRQSGEPTAMARADGMDMGAQEYLMMVGRRQSARLVWQEFFQDWDVVIAPMTIDSAFPHQEGDMSERTLMVDNNEVPYGSNILFPMLAIFSGLPSTAFPAGLDAKGLPLGLQVIGPYLEDRTTLAFAELLEQAWYRFEPPPAYR